MHLGNICLYRSQDERGKSAQLRSNTDTLINSVATMVWDNWNNTNNALNKRTGEMSEAKNNIQLHLHKTQQEIFDIERNIDLLRKAIQDKANPLMVAQTRLEARGHRAGIEQCKYEMISLFYFGNFNLCFFFSFTKGTFHMFGWYKKCRTFKRLSMRCIKNCMMPSHSISSCCIRNRRWKRI